MKNKTLSEKRMKVINLDGKTNEYLNVYWEEDVKQTFKEILDEIEKRKGYSSDIDNELEELKQIIKQKAGEMLIK